MGTFYIETLSSAVASGQKVIYEMSATTDVSVSKGSTITTYPVQSGRVFVDNIIVDDGSISFEGVITDVAFSDMSGNKPTGSVALAGLEFVEQYVEQIKTRMDNKELFTFYFSSILKPLTDCVITNFKYSKDNTLGKESWKISISAQPIRFGVRAQYLTEPAVDWVNLINGNKKGASNKSTVSESSQEEIAFTNCMGNSRCKLADGRKVSREEWSMLRDKYFADKKKTVKKV